jgi:starch-binding outer membrane protein, SusD/RagB family
MKNIIKYKFLILIGIVLGSCSKDFLEQVPTGSLTDEVYFATLDGIGMGVTGVYATLNVQPAGLHNLDMMFLGFGSIPSDDAEAGGESGGNDLIDFQHMDQGIPQTSDQKALSDNFWGYNYKSILYANSVLLGIASFRANNTNLDAADQALLNQYEGEMEFILAFVHFKMMQVYGGVPIVDHPLSSSEYNIKRNTIAECLHFVEERLIRAVDLLPLKSAYSDEDMGHATKGAAQALLAKAYLYEASYSENYAGDERFTGCTNTYDKALVQAEQVIASGEYVLVGINGETFDTYWNQNGSTLYPTRTPGYRYIFTVDGENSGESVFEIQSINDGLGYMQSRGTYLTIYTTARDYNNSTSLGWGFNCPTEDLLNAYDANDPRKIVSIGLNGAPVYIADAWAVLNCEESPTNMIGRKWEASPDQFWGTYKAAGNGPNNFAYIRYADVILMAAEAAFKTQDAGKALNYVNQVRKRARNGEALGDPADLISITFDDIIKERRLELAMEGQRFFDLVRWGKQSILTGQELQKYLMGNPQESNITCQFTPGKNDFFPIPEVEVINSNYNLVQYPGW